jgi:hypothetical protein
MLQGISIFLEISLLNMKITVIAPQARSNLGNAAGRDGGTVEVYQPD